MLERLVLVEREVIELRERRDLVRRVVALRERAARARFDVLLWNGTTFVAG